MGNRKNIMTGFYACRVAYSGWDFRDRFTVESPFTGNRVSIDLDRDDLRINPRVADTLKRIRDRVDMRWGEPVPVPLCYYELLNVKAAAVLNPGVDLFNN